VEGDERICIEHQQLKGCWIASLVLFHRSENLLPSSSAVTQPAGYSLHCISSICAFWNISMGPSRCYGPSLDPSYSALALLGIVGRTLPDGVHG
jgi:hypothetical protein